MKLKANRNLVYKRLHEAWDSLGSGNLEKAYQIINRAAWGGKSYKLDEELANKLYWLWNYEYPELKNINDEVKREFTLVTTWNLIMEAHSQDLGWALMENLTPFLGIPYELDLDIKKIRSTFIPHLELLNSTYQQHSLNQWSELSKASKLSLLARSLFVRILMYAQVNSGGLTDARAVAPFDAPDIQMALLELTENNLISLNLPVVDLLMNMTVDKLKKFAFDNGINIHGTKYQIAQSISMNTPEITVMNWLSQNNSSNLIRPLVREFQTIKNNIWSASADIGFYLRWLREVKYLSKSIEIVADERNELLQANRYQYKPLEPYRTLSRNRKRSKNVLKNKKVQLIAEMWDTECDNFLREVAQKYAWDLELNILDVINSQSSHRKIVEIKKVCKSDLKLIDFCYDRLYDLGIDVHRPNLLTCEECGIIFSDWSVDKEIAERIDYKICFCKPCYMKAFWGSRDGTTDRDKMLDHLSTVATILGIVPISSFRNRRLNLSNLTKENQIILVKALIYMPPYKAYLDEFGSWLQTLILAGILDGNTQRTSRGVRCIASDGHVCNSLAEKTIDDWLSAHDIYHEKEPLYPYHFHLNTSRMRADWKVKDIMIEYAGMMSEPSYAAKMKAKQELAREFQVLVMILEPKDILDLDEKLKPLINL